MFSSEILQSEKIVMPKIILLELFASDLQHLIVEEICCVHVIKLTDGGESYELHDDSQETLDTCQVNQNVYFNSETN